MIISNPNQDTDYNNKNDSDSSSGSNYHEVDKESIEKNEESLRKLRERNKKNNG